MHMKKRERTGALPFIDCALLAKGNASILVRKRPTEARATPEEHNR
jgi:hypothetical protein